MPRIGSLEIERTVRALAEVGEGAASSDRKLRRLAMLRRTGDQVSLGLDARLIAEIEKKCKGLEEAAESQGELRKLLEKLVAPPWHSAIFMRLEETPFGEEAPAGAVPSEGPRAIVSHGGTCRAVPVAEGIDPASLRPGDEVFISSERNAVLGQASRPYSTGEAALLSRYTEDGRMVLKSRDEEIIVDVAAALADQHPEQGDLVRWERSLGMAFERMERAKGQDIFIEETPKVTFDDIGGLDSQIEKLKAMILVSVSHAEVARAYLLEARRAVLFSGSPGNGKTMMAKALANWAATLSKTGRSHFVNVPPAKLLSMWYGETEANIRRLFTTARKAGEENPEVPVILFIDECDSLFATRGTSRMHIDDRVVGAFTQELDGLEDRGNVFVVCATNRVDTLDPALFRPGRLSDCVIEVLRPGMAAARQILGKHLEATVPYAENGHGDDPAATRRDIIDCGVSKMFSQNGEGELATATLRDAAGTRRTIRMSDLVSGARIANVAASAKQKALDRHVKTGRPGVTLADVLDAVGEEFESAARALTPLNIRNYVEDLPADVEVVAVEPVKRKVRRKHRYIRLT